MTARISTERISRRGFLTKAGTAGAVGAGAIALGGIEGFWADLGQAATGICGIDEGKVTFPPSEVIHSNASAADEAALIHVVTSLWRRYLAMDLGGVKDLLAPDVVRMSGRFGAGAVQVGADAVLAGLPFEWTSNERPNGIISEQWTIRRAEFWVDGSGTSATVLYWGVISGGSRWCYSDLGLVMHALTKQGGRWRVSHWTDSYNLTYDLVHTQPGADAFSFDFSYPVKNLPRATRFYSELCGPPESSSDHRTVYNLNGSRFVLDATGLHGVAKITHGFPNGWATIYVDDVHDSRERHKRHGVRFLAGTGTKLLRRGSDPFAIPLDEPNRTSNPFVIMQRNYAAGGPEPGTPTGFGGSDPGIEAANQIANAWVRMHPAGIADLYGSHGRWFDDTRTKSRGFDRGPDVARAMSAKYWPRYDRSTAGLSADLAASSMHVRSLGERKVVSYRALLSGTGEHPFRETSMVTHILDLDGKPLVSMTVAGDPRPGMALSLDYTGCPTTDIPTSDTFYTDRMKLGTHYVDAGYRGWWSDTDLVYGVYRAHPGDGLIRPRHPTGYMSFWVPSAEHAYRWLKHRGSSFPLIKAINNRPGVDPNPGYTQVLATDTEGNDLLCTEYTGN